MSSKNDSNLGNKVVFSENLKYYISRNGETQRDVAKVARVSEGTVCDWIKRRTYPRMDKIQLMAEHWGIQMSDLVEERSMDNQYYVKKESNIIAEKLAKSPETLGAFKNFFELSKSNRLLVIAMINSLKGGQQ